MRSVELRAVDFAAMPDVDHQDQQPIVCDLVNDAVVAHTHPIDVCAAAEFAASVWSRLTRQCIDGLSQSLVEIGAGSMKLGAWSPARFPTHRPLLRIKHH